MNAVLLRLVETLIIANPHHPRGDGQGYGRSTGYGFGDGSGYGDGIGRGSGINSNFSDYTDGRLTIGDGWVFGYSDTSGDGRGYPGL